jgi:hypothetical protein
VDKETSDHVLWFESPSDPAWPGDAWSKTGEADSQPGRHPRSSPACDDAAEEPDSRTAAQGPTEPATVTRPEAAEREVTTAPHSLTPTAAPKPPSLPDDSGDPSDRLAAIKLRLANQMKNS